jgi:pimeloyl-ACP methyl ester carboxylesterase
MPRFESHGVAIAYEDVGTSRPIVLVHGFAADRTTNWKTPGLTHSRQRGGGSSRWIAAAMVEARALFHRDLSGPGVGRDSTRGMLTAAV